MTKQDIIQRQLDRLYWEHAVWSRRAEQAIIARNFDSIAASNADHITAMIRALEFVLSGKPLPCVYEDNGSRYSLAIESK